MKHPQTIEDPHAKAVIGWEPLGQIDPDQLPAPSETYPAPWTCESRGNGHMDVFDAQGRYFAHVFCWDDRDFKVFDEKMASARR